MLPSTSSALSSLQATFDAQQTERQQRFQATLDEQHANVKASLDQFDENTDEQLAKFAEATAKVAKDFADLSEERIAALSAKATAHLQALQQYQEQAEELLEAIGTRGMAASYQEYTQAQERQASFWRWVTVGLGLAAAAAVAVFLFWEDATPANISATAKGSLAATIPIVASYCSRQAAGHRKEARRARDIHLRMQEPRAPATRMGQHS